MTREIILHSAKIGQIRQLVQLLTFSPFVRRQILENLRYPTYQHCTSQFLSLDSFTIVRNGPIKIAAKLFEAGYGYSKNNTKYWIEIIEILYSWHTEGC